MSSDDVTRRLRPAPLLKLGSGQLVALREGTRFELGKRQLDLCFVFDTTGSMADKIDGLVRCMDALVADLGKIALEWRVTTVPFGDLTVSGDRVVADLPFVTDVQSASAQLRSMPRFSGGGNLGESSVEAMLAACGKSYRAKAVTVLVLITDEPALGTRQASASVHQALTAIDAACFTVAPDLPYYRDWATQHAGEWRAVAAAVDTSAIVQLFQGLLSRVAAVADSVHRLGAGSVRAYLDRGAEG